MYGVIVGYKEGQNSGSKRNHISLRQSIRDDFYDFI